MSILYMHVLVANIKTPSRSLTFARFTASDQSIGN